MKGLLTLKELSIEQIQGIITYAEELKHECRVSYNNKKFATLFFENSTRTHYSFISALMNLGIKVIDVNTQGSSIAKGETLHEDTPVESHTDEVDGPEAECVEEDDSITVPAGCHVKNYLRKTYGHCFAKGSVQDWDVTENDDGSKTIRNVKWGRKLSPQELALIEY